MMTITSHCLLYTSDAADEEDSVALGGRRHIKKKKKNSTVHTTPHVWNTHVDTNTTKKHT